MLKLIKSSKVMESMIIIEIALGIIGLLALEITVSR